MRNIDVNEDTSRHTPMKKKLELSDFIDYPQLKITCYLASSSRVQHVSISRVQYDLNVQQRPFPLRYYMFLVKRKNLVYDTGYSSSKSDIHVREKLP